jgi:hypothetical protein
VQHTIEVLQLQKMPTPQQVEILTPRIQMANRVAFDYTGPGIGMGDYLAHKFGEYNPKQHKFGKIELCTFTNDLKNHLFSKLRMAFERIKLRIPIKILREKKAGPQLRAAMQGQPCACGRGPIPRRGQKPAKAVGCRFCPPVLGMGQPLVI